MEQQERFMPKGKATDVFDRDAAKRFQTDLYNLALDKDVAKKRNLLYLVLLAICVLVTLFVITTASYKTYVVRVDNATGQIEAGGELKATNYEPQEAEIRAFLVQFIKDTRTIPLDPVQYRKIGYTRSTISQKKQRKNSTQFCSMTIQRRSSDT